MTPVSAANASPPTVTLSQNVVSGSASEAITVSNPSSNAYALTALTITAPSGWTFSTANYETSDYGCHSTSSSVSCTLALSPGASVTTFDFFSIATAPAPSTANAITGTVTTTVQDGSSAAYYAGPTQKLYSVGASAALAISYGATDSCVTGTYTAGTPACNPTVTLTTTNNLGNAGVPIEWAVTSTYGTVSPTTGVTAASANGGVASTTFQPTDTVADGPSAIKASAGTSTAITPAPSSIATGPGAPSEVTFLISGESSNYLSTQGTTTNTSPTTHTTFTGAELAAASGTYSIADKFGNSIAFNTANLVVSSVSLTALSASGVFDTTNLPSTVSCTTNAACIATPYGTGSAVSGDLPYNYFQSGVYGSVGQFSATISGTYGAGATAFTIAGNSGTATTGTFSATSPTPAVSNAAPTAGSSISVYATLPTVQQGVPVNIALDLPGTGAVTLGDGAYVGTFSNGLQYITLDTNSSGMVQTSFKVDTLEGAEVTFTMNATAPTYAAPTHDLANVTGTVPQATTAAGPAASFKVNAYYYASGNPPVFSGPATNTVSSGTLYLDVTLVDAYGNDVTLAANANTLQVNLAASTGLLSATNVYITAGHSTTGSSFGAVIYTAPSTLGTAKITATGVVAGQAVSGETTIGVVSANPTIGVSSPLPMSGVIYANSTPVVFHGSANASIGYPTTGVAAATIASVCYTAGTLSSCSSETANQVTWAIAVNIGAGLHTISFNATDSNGNTAQTGTYSVLVDTSAPSVNFVTVPNANISSPATVTATITDSLGDLNSSSVSAVATNIQTSATQTLSVSVSGTNNVGHSVTYGVTISGLTTGNWSIALSAADLAGNVNSSQTLTVHVTVPFAQSFVVSGTPQSATIGSFSGISASYTNLNPTAQSVVVFAVYKNGAGQTVGIGTGSLTVGAGVTQSVFIAEPVGLASGTYSVSIFVFTTGNLPVSVSTSISVTV